MDPINKYNGDSKKVSSQTWSINESANEGKDDYQPDPKKEELFEELSRRYERQKQNREKDIVNLELTPELEQAGIVEHFDFYSKTNAIHILLNHQYTGKSIVFSVDKKDWNKTHNIFGKQLKQKGVSNEHIMQLTDVLDNNYKAIFGLDGDGGLNPQSYHNNSGHSSKNNDNDNDEEPTKITSKSQVYKLGNHFLAEGVIIGEHNTPCWITSESLTGQISVQEFIDITSDDGNQKKLLYPPSKSAYLNEPYTFESIDQIKQLIEDVKTNETPDTLFSKIKTQWKKYVNESDNHISLCCGDCIFTLFQDRLGITHYLFFVGDNEVGKSTNLFMFKYLAYRAFLAIDVSVANIYRFYGNEFEGIGTFLEDEIDDLDEQPDKLKMYKSGYTRGLKVPKSEKASESLGFEQEGYYTFGFKAFAAEKMPLSHRAKGFRERTIEMPCTFGLPECDIQDVVNNADDPKHKALLAELNDLRNRLLIYRLVHYHDPILDIDVQLQAREKQLWKPLLRVFQNSPNTFDILKKVATGYIKESREQKSHTQTAFLVRMISDLVKEKNTYTLATSDIWKRYIELLPEGEQIGKSSYKSNEYGDMSQKRLNELLRDQFKARPPRHTRNVRELVFDKIALDRMKQKYRINSKNKSETDESDETDISLDKHMSEQNSNKKTTEKEEENPNNSIKNEENEANYNHENAVLFVIKFCILTRYNLKRV
jgi:hypothetical protein